MVHRTALGGGDEHEPDDYSSVVCIIPACAFRIVRKIDTGKISIIYAEFVSLLSACDQERRQCYGLENPVTGLRQASLGLGQQSQPNMQEKV